MSDDIKSMYEMIDVNIYQENIFHTRMLLKEFNLQNYLFNINIEDLSISERSYIIDLLWKEMREIFYGRNIPIIKKIKK